MTEKNAPETKRLHDWLVIEIWDHVGGLRLYQCAKCEKQEQVPYPQKPNQEGCSK